MPDLLDAGPQGLLGLAVRLPEVVREAAVTTAIALAIGALAAAALAYSLGLP